MGKGKIVTMVLVFLASIIVVAVFVNNGKASEYKYIGDVVETENIELELANLELMCLADSQEEAEDIAQAYGIELVSFDMGVAVFKSDKPYSELITYGEENDLKRLSINHIQEIFERN